MTSPLCKIRAYSIEGLQEIKSLEQMRATSRSVITMKAVENCHGNRVNKIVCLFEQN